MLTANCQSGNTFLLRSVHRVAMERAWAMPLSGSMEADLAVVSIQQLALCILETWNGEVSQKALTMLSL